MKVKGHKIVNSYPEVKQKIARNLMKGVLSGKVIQFGMNSLGKENLISVP